MVVWLGENVVAYCALFAGLKSARHIGLVQYTLAGRTSAFPAPSHLVRALQWNSNLAPCIMENYL
jgi:hypothetical protein